MSDEPFISIVIPTYNRAQQVAAAINSVLTQTYLEFEIVVIDDGSSDRTAEEIEGIVSRRSKGGQRMPEIRYFHQVNQGQSTARNNGIARARGDWIAFLDSDDIWLPQKLAWQVRAIEHHKDTCRACFTDARLVDRRNLDTTAFAHASWHYEELIGVISDPAPSLAKAFGGAWVQTLVARSNLIQKIGGFDPDLHFGEDYDFLFRLALETPFCYVNQPLAVIDRTNSQVDPTEPTRSWDKVEFRLGAQQYMYEKWLRSAEYPADIRRTIVDNIRNVHSGWANWYLQTGRFDQARRAVSRAMHYQPTPQLAIKWALTWSFPHIARRIIPKAEVL